jgi:hypothetical protein
MTPFLSPSDVAVYWEAPDDEGIDPIFNQQNISGGSTVVIHQPHTTIAYDETLKKKLWAAANAANVPVPQIPSEFQNEQPAKNLGN